MERDGGEMLEVTTKGRKGGKKNAVASIRKNGREKRVKEKSAGDCQGRGQQSHLEKG